MLRNWAVVRGEELRGLERTACVLGNREARLKRERKRVLKIEIRERKDRGKYQDRKKER